MKHFSAEAAEFATENRLTVYMQNTSAATPMMSVELEHPMTEAMKKTIAGIIGTSRQAHDLFLEADYVERCFQIF